jgi:hypothetical protein
LWLLPAAGAVIGLASTFNQRKREKKELERQKGIQEQAFNYGQEHSDNMFSLRKTEALEHLGVQRRNLDTQLGLAVDDFNTSLLGQAFGIQDARIQTNSAVGAHQAAEAASGTRGSAAGEMIRDYATQGLERNVELQERQNASHLNQMITGANTAADAISREKASWHPGGFRYQEKGLQDTYNLNIHNLGMKDFDHRINQANPWNLKDNWLDYTASMFSGASTGMSMGRSIENFNWNWGNIFQRRKKEEPGGPLPEGLGLDGTPLRIMR